MQVNWAGQWEDENGNFDFTHYPYWVLKKFRENEYDNYVMANVKKLAYSDSTLRGPKNLKPLMRAAFKAKFASKKAVIKTIKQLAMASQMESYIQKTNNLNTGEQFFESMGRKAKPQMVRMYNEIKNANIISKELSSNSDITLNDFLKSKKLVFEPPIKGYNISGFDMLKKDISSLSKTTKDKNYKKILKKSLVEISQLERNFLIVQNLNNHNITDQQRPLYFFQSKS